MKVPLSFRSEITRDLVARMMSPWYAKARNEDINDAYLRCWDAVQGHELYERIVTALYLRIGQGQDEKQQMRIAKRLAKRKRFTAIEERRKDAGAWAALTIAIDEGARVTSGEAFDLLRTEEGQMLLSDGLALFADAIAVQLKLE